jgi:superfamily II DNA or RNA helicase
MLRLRDYQEEAVQTVIDEARQGVRRQLVVLPTGAGKTIVAAALSVKASGRVLMLVHRDELVQQSVEKFGYIWPEQSIGVVKAERDEHDRRVVVASVQTLQHKRRRDRLDKDEFSLVIVDEAHHSPAASYRQTLEDLGFLPDPSAGRLLLGITATPMRGDGIGLKGVFEKIVYRRSISDLVRAGYLADVKGIRVRTTVDLRKVRTVRGDFQAKDLSLAVDTPRRNEMIVDAYRKHGEGRRAVAFTVDIAHAQHIAEAFREGGFRADWVSGELPIEARRERLRRLREGEIDVLANCQVLTEGWDEPSISCLIMARPTKSTGLYIQMAGRGLRPYPGKDYCLVMDVTDNAHDICALGTLDGDDADFANGRKTGPLDGSPAGDKEEPGEIGGGVQVVISTMDLLARSKFRWRIERQRMILEAGPGQEITLEEVDQDLWSVTLRRGRDLQPLTERPLPVSYAQGVAEDYVRANQLESYAARDAAWLKKPVSQAQLDLLRREFNIVPPRGTTRGEAQEIIRRTFRDRSLNDPNAPWRQDPASGKQIAWMEAHGFPVPPGFTKGDFSDLMEKLKSRGRRRRA